MKKLTLFVFTIILFSSYGFSASFNSCSTISTSGSHVLSASLTDVANSKCFEITANDVIFNCQNFVIDGTDAGSSIGIELNANNITIRNCEVRDFNNGIVALGDNFVIENSRLESNTFRGIYVNAVNTGNLNNINTTSNERGINVENSQNIFIDNHISTSASSYGLAIESNSNNIVYNNSKVYSAGGYGVYGSSVSNITIDNGFFNTCTNGGMQFMSSVTDSVVSNSYFNGTGTALSMAISINQNSNNNTFYRNRFENHGTTNGAINFWQSRDNVFYMNNLTSESHVNSISSWTTYPNQFYTTEFGAELGNYWRNFATCSTNSTVNGQVVCTSDDVTIDSGSSTIDPAPIFILDLSPPAPPSPPSSSGNSVANFPSFGIISMIFSLGIIGLFLF